MKFGQLTRNNDVKSPIEVPGVAMRAGFAWIGAALWALAAAPAHAQIGPFSPTNWPPTISASATVDYVIIDPNAAFHTPCPYQKLHPYTIG